MVLREEIRSAFADVGLQQVNDDILSKCVSLASTSHTSPSQMAEIWEAHSLNKNVTELTDHTFQAYKNALMKEADVVGDDPDVAARVSSGAVVSRPGLGKRNIAMVTPTPNKRRNAQGSNATASSSVDAVAARVSISPNKASPLATKKAIVTPKYNERTNVGKVVASFNPQNLPSFDSSATMTTTPRCVVSSSFDTNVKKKYRHMFTTLEERAKALDDHLVNLGEVIVERFGIGKEEENGLAPLEAVGVPRQEKICCVGRVCNEAHEGRINQTSVLLEGSRHLSGGTRVSVDLSQLKESKTSFSLFPGQIICVEGINSSGRKLVAHRICEGAAHGPRKTPVQNLMRFHHDLQDGQPLKLLAVCGPYTASDNLDYEPLIDLLQGVVAEKPDVVILAGPFVDMRQDQVASGNMILGEDGEQVCLDYETFFANKIATLIEETYENDDLHTQFVLVPSLEDANSEWVYPQAPLTDSRANGGKAIKLPDADGIEFGSLGLHHVETAGGRVASKDSRRVHRVSNPCTLQVNEVVIGVTSTDTLFHTNSDETSANLEPGTRLARIAQHLVQQRSYYPLFPPHKDTNLDLKHMEQWSMPCQPDVLIVPSKLTCFARTVLDNKTVVVNPGQLTRSTTGGTYAVMDINPIKRDTLENAGGADVEMEHGVQDRIRVEIKRI